MGGSKGSGPDSKELAAPANWQPRGRFGFEARDEAAVADVVVVWREVDIAAVERRAAVSFRPGVERRHVERRPRRSGREHVLRVVPHQQAVEYRAGTEERHEVEVASVEGGAVVGLAPGAYHAEVEGRPR